MRIALVVALTVTLATVSYWWNGRTTPLALTPATATSAMPPPAPGTRDATEVEPQPTPVTPPVTFGSEDAGYMATRLLSVIDEESDPVAREQAAEAGARQIPRALLGKVLLHLQALPASERLALATRALLLRWAWEEPTGAANWALQWGQGDLRRTGLAAAAAGWTRAQPTSLLTWANTLSPDDRAWVLLNAGSYVARTDPSAFSSWQANLPDSREKEKLLVDTALRWADQDALAVARQLSTPPSENDGVWRQHLSTALAHSLATTTDLSEATSVLNALPVGPAQTTAFSGFVNGWARRDPEVVATWLNGLSDPALRAQLSSQLAGEWGRSNATEAENWAASLPAGPIADAVRTRLAETKALPFH